jgi:hypothetical protein
VKWEQHSTHPHPDPPGSGRERGGHDKGGGRVTIIGSVVFTDEQDIEVVMIRPGRHLVRGPVQLTPGRTKVRRPHVEPHAELEFQFIAS